jgi:hypothetical protein
MPASQCPPRFILEVSFECDYCGADTPARDGIRARLEPEGWPAVNVDLCPACYEDAVASGVLDAPQG